MKNIPLATYRIQFNPGFGFKKARGIIPYLAELGISTVYASPVFKAQKGSSHGYDIVDSNQINPELGGRADFDGLLMEVRRAGMSWVQDIVPNHMAVDSENTMLMDVLEHGPSSRYFRFFDINWDHPYDGLKGRLLVPCLGKFFGVALENGEITLHYDQHGFTIHYYDHIFPLKIESYAQILTLRSPTLETTLCSDHPDIIKLLGLLYVLNTISSRQPSGERYDQVNFIKVMLWELYSRNKAIRTFLDRNIKLCNGQAGLPESMQSLEKLLLEQFFRLAFWKVATEEINYRRFFNINKLISLRMEDSAVLAHTHSLIFELIRQKEIAGLRIDHVDGLYDPTSYLRNIRKKVRDIYLVVEKILAPEEELPSSWPVQGTTGYDFMNFVNGLFCDQRHAKAFDRIYGRFVGPAVPYPELVFAKKKWVAEKHMAGDVDNLAMLMKNIFIRHRHGSDITLQGLRRAISDLLAYFPVYRTYMSSEFSRPEDRGFIRQAIQRTMERNPDLSYELGFIENLLCLNIPEHLSREERAEWLHLVMRFQQFTGPLMAKGFEDTVLYIANRLISLNEVGSEPQRFGVSLDSFHRFNSRRLEHHPNSMNATATHDTKRGEDVRARINVLSELHGEWEKMLKIWHRTNRKIRQHLDGRAVPEANDEYFLYQTLLGSFPLGDGISQDYLQRMKDYLVKATREAKMYSNWLRPNTAYESAFLAFFEKICVPGENNPFLASFLPFQKKVALYGVWNSLAQTLLKITAPGVPDFYQGTELWDFSLVDPDNRRPVNFERRARLLAEIKNRQHDLSDFLTELLATREDGRIKLFLIHRALIARKKNADLFQKGVYIPLKTHGLWHNHLIAFARRDQKSLAITITPRFLTGMIDVQTCPLGEQVWKDTHLVLPTDSPHIFRNAITGDKISAKKKLFCAEIFSRFPVALLVSGPTRHRVHPAKNSGDYEDSKELSG
ncbi:MAG: malto-oligosyltrehalose synthase [Deltaproteobacteria bacterium RIFOXYD12_FULL_57_12]|nr:MAG: malto-oligosyltrehalose synthase [Deltaproteobacteria bacterium RIFOXYD12_FULL_57_12]